MVTLAFGEEKKEFDFSLFVKKQLASLFSDQSIDGGSKRPSNFMNRDKVITLDEIDRAIKKEHSSHHDEESVKEDYKSEK